MHILADSAVYKVYFSVIQRFQQWKSSPHENLLYFIVC